MELYPSEAVCGGCVLKNIHSQCSLKFVIQPLALLSSCLPLSKFLVHAVILVAMARVLLAPSAQAGHLVLGRVLSHLQTVKPAPLVLPL